MTYDQVFVWCFEHSISMHFRQSKSGKREVVLYTGDEVIGRGKSVLAAFQDAKHTLAQQAVSA